MDLVRALFVAALLLGPLAWLHRRATLPPGWHPLLVFCASTVVVLLAGIAGHLPLGLLLLVLAAAAMLVRELVIDRSNLVAALREPTTVVLGVTAVLVAVLVHGRVFTHYDNFSHWAMVWRVMLDHDVLPGPDNDVVTFTTYPLGGASFAYLVSRLVGSAEWVAMWGHSLFLAACALPVASAAGTRRVLGVVLYVIGTLALITHITRPSSLLVDSLVAGLGAALLMLLLMEREALLAQPWVFGVVSAALVTVKSSGLFFVAVGTVLAVLLLVQHRASIHRRDWCLWIMSVGLPWATWWVWGLHVSETFPDAEAAKHSVSLDRFGSVLGEKTYEDVRTILGDLLLATVTDWTLLLLIVGVLAAGVLLVRDRVLAARDQRRILLTILVTAVLWEVSLGLMYLFSMPLGEALQLAGFARYQGTYHLVVALVLLSMIGRWAATRPIARSTLARHDGTGPVLVSLAVAVFCVALPLSLVHRGALARGEEETRHSLEEVLAGVEPSAGHRVCLLQERTDGGYRVWISRYLMQHREVSSIVVKPSASALPRSTDECDYMVLLDPRPHTAQLLTDGGFPVGTGPLPQVVKP